MIKINFQTCQWHIKLKLHSGLEINFHKVLPSALHDCTIVQLLCTKSEMSHIPCALKDFTPEQIIKVDSHLIIGTICS